MDAPSIEELKRLTPAQERIRDEWFPGMTVRVTGCALGVAFRESSGALRPLVSGDRVVISRVVASLQGVWWVIGEETDKILALASCEPVDECDAPALVIVPQENS